ncbi:MAG: hypothetical protein AVDCRST_MAG75-2539 [uncultured Propionibacteriaceae bacterium]|uniref:DUF2630 domain-containing protein n=1 Tax=uncultured Propionibacteriaceae bacterium TaxID=257457 RepID=A0A6J4PEA5_9ACTN|nr:MAG: hypothetical protein AVDCRST_MAG75-2539 [uncultured Propionibacteriaceae bacterium]
MEDDGSIRVRIAALIDREHNLRFRRQAGSLSEEEEHLGLLAAEEELDQCWDLLRQRRAKREYGLNADEAHPRSTAVVENYWQ